MEIFALQGGMAVGKTTALRSVKQLMPHLVVSFEENREVIEEIKKRKLSKQNYQDYLEIQRLFIRNELKRYQNYPSEAIILTDYGAEEIYFHTLAFPKVVGKNWPVAEDLKIELAELKKWFPKKVLFLKGTNDTLLKRKESDFSRSRTSFTEYQTKFMPLKEDFLSRFFNIDTLVVDDLDKDEVGKKVLDWLLSELKKE